VSGTDVNTGPPQGTLSAPQCGRSESQPRIDRGRSIRSTREQKRYSQEAFAPHAGFDRSSYDAIEHGEFNVSLDMIVKVAAGLDMTVAALCEKAKI
jgi:DNA-binding XRE family transcriptional regulator